MHCVIVWDFEFQCDKFMKKIAIILSFSAIIFTFIWYSSHIKFFLANVPAYLSGHYVAYKNINYGDKEWQKLDIYVPNSVHNAPVITFFYGGGWYQGKKEEYQFVADTLTKNGFIVVIPDYAKYPQQKYPAFEYDAALATLWIKENIQNYNGNVKNVHLMGHSAGGHIGAMMLADKSYLKTHGLTPNFYRSFVGLSAPYHFTPSEEKYKNIFSDLKSYESMQASHYIDGTESPMLLVYGTKDSVVGKINIEHFSKAILHNNGDYKILYYDIDHTSTISAFTRLPIVKNEKIVDDVVSFIRKNSL
jgi:dipeptidyl aminopeptidase/acylaminoacyl peptidase